MSENESHDVEQEEDSIDGVDEENITLKEALQLANRLKTFCLNKSDAVSLLLVNQLQSNFEAIVGMTFVVLGQWCSRDGVVVREYVRDDVFIWPRDRAKVVTKSGFCIRVRLVSRLASNNAARTWHYSPLCTIVNRKAQMSSWQRAISFNTALNNIKEKRDKIEEVFEEAKQIAISWGVEPTLTKVRKRKTTKYFDELSNDELLFYSEQYFKTQI
ncbi:hypothetical protein QTP88_010647 [Uroleucon formosanum]